MEAQDSPLNVAHQLERKAERCLAAARYEDAIICHQRAADFIEDAMSLTPSPQALESLRLQRSHHLKQKEIIWEKQRRSLLILSKQHAKDTQTDGGDITADNKEAFRLQLNNVCPPSEELSVFRTVEECDSLLQFLNRRALVVGGQEHGQPSSLPYASTANTDTDNAENVSSPQTNGVKIAVDDKLLIEELVLHNRALRQHILQLLQELEEKDQLLRERKHNDESQEQQPELQHQYQQDTTDRSLTHTAPPVNSMPHQDTTDRGVSHPALPATIMEVSMIQSTQYEDEEEEEPMYSFPGASFPGAINLDKLPQLELPPLEMPQFDLDVLCSRGSDKSEEA